MVERIVELTDSDSGSWPAPVRLSPGTPGPGWGVPGVGDGVGVGVGVGDGVGSGFGVVLSANT